MKKINIIQRYAGSSAKRAHQVTGIPGNNACTNGKKGIQGYVNVRKSSFNDDCA